MEHLYLMTKLQTVVLPADYDATTRPWYKLVENKTTTAFTTPSH